MSGKYDINNSLGSDMRMDSNSPEYITANQSELVASQYNIDSETMKEEYLLLMNKLEEENSAYIVETAPLRCSMQTNDVQTLIHQNEQIDSIPDGEKIEEMSKLKIQENREAILGGHIPATVTDTKGGLRDAKNNLAEDEKDEGLNIASFGNCQNIENIFLLETLARELCGKMHSMGKNPELEALKEKIKAAIKQGKGTCYCCMLLNPKWENISINRSYQCFNGKEGINMMSMLFCTYGGGLITAIKSGQNVFEIFEKPRESLTEDDLKELGYSFQTGSERVRGLIFDYLFPRLYLTGNSYGETELNRVIEIMNNDKIAAGVAKEYINALNDLGKNINLKTGEPYTVEEMINILSWNQDKINRTYEECYRFSVEKGILISPKLALAIIQVEGTGSYDTNSEVKKHYDNENGPQHDFETDTEYAFNLIYSKLGGYLVYGDEYRRAAQEIGITENLLFTYLCQDTPKLGKNTTGEYASSGQDWIDLVSERYQDFGQKEETASRDYVKDYEFFFAGYDTELIENTDTVEYEFTNNGVTVVVNKKQK